MTTDQIAGNEERQSCHAAQQADSESVQKPENVSGSKSQQHIREQKPGFKVVTGRPSGQIADDIRECSGINVRSKPTAEASEQQDNSPVNDIQFRDTPEITPPFFRYL